MIIQIYEIQTPKEARTMIDLGVDHIGSVLLSAPQWKDMRLKHTVETVQTAGRKSSLIPLFRDIELIADAIEFYRPDIIHFCETLTSVDHGTADLKETWTRQQQIRDRYPDLEIMRSIPIAVTGAHVRLPSLEIARVFEPISDWFLTDTMLIDHVQQPSNSDQPVTGFVGITGQTCDWGVARDLVAQSRIPVILAGGISPANVVSGIMSVLPAGVDSCTQTNKLDDQGRPIRFKKDPNKVRNLVNEARQATGQKASDNPAVYAGRNDSAANV